MVCHNAFVGNYSKELNDSLDVDILSDEVSENVPEETKEFILKMTRK